MAFGFPAYHNEQLKHHLTKELAESIAKKALLNLGFTELGIHDKAIDFKTQGTAMALAERILIYVGKTEIRVHSECLNPAQFLDFGKNKKNVEKVLEEFFRLAEEEEEN